MPLAICPEGPKGNKGRPRAGQPRPGHHSDPTQVGLCPLPVCVEVGDLRGVGLPQQEQADEGSEAWWAGHVHIPG